jgi:hypothetical protein
VSIGDVIHFEHPQTGKRSAGLYVREWPEHRAIGVLIPGKGERVIHQTHVVQPVTTSD